MIYMELKKYTGKIISKMINVGTLSEGLITMRFYANDTAGNLSFEEITVTKYIPPQEFDPTIVIVSIAGGIGVIAGVYIFMKKRRSPN